MTDKVLELACLLAAYEMDSPHVSSPDLDVGEEDKQHYPDVSKEDFKKWLESDHCGDCIKLPAPCIRCFANDIYHKAKWILDRFNI